MDRQIRRRRRERERIRRKRKVMIFSMTFLVLLIISISAWIIYLMGSIKRVSMPERDELLYIGRAAVVKDNRNENQIDSPGIPINKNREKDIVNTDAINSETSNKEIEIIYDNKVTNIALFGVDRRYKNQSSRSDSIMVISIDGKSNKIKVTSLMRDMYVPIPGRRQNRINAAYAFGGPLLAVKTINSNFELDIRDYISVDFFGMEKVVDKVGGINLNVSSGEAVWLNDYLKELNYLSGNNVDFVKGGFRLLNGRQAVAYCRIRYVGNADYERTERQRRVLNEVYKKIKSQGIFKLPGIISALLPYVETSLSNAEIINLAVNAARFNNDTLEQFRIPVDGSFTSQRIRGMAVLVPNMEKNKKRLHEFIYDGS